MNRAALQLELGIPVPPLPPPVATVLSYGGGLDSWVLLLLAVARGIRLDAVVMADVGAPGDLGEWPSTYRHVNEVVRPFCREHGIEFVLLDAQSYPVRQGHRDEARSLWSWLWGRFTTTHRRGIQFPTSGPGRLCTKVAKAERVDRWLRDRYGDKPVELWIGFEANETKRAKKDANQGNSKQRRNRYPLIEWGLCRCRLEAITRASGYPVPRKSACLFCPYSSKADLRTLRRELPDAFAAICALEEAKPVTRKGKGFKLRLKGWDSRKARRLGPGKYRAPPLAKWVDLPDCSRPRPPCPVCGAPVPATKATGCGYLEEPMSRRREAA